VELILPKARVCWVEEAANGKKGHGYFLHTSSILGLEGSKESCDDRPAGALAICKYEGEALKQVGGHLLSECVVSTDEVQESFPILEMEPVVQIQRYFDCPVWGIADNVIVDYLAQLSCKAKDSAFWFKHN
jgi:hypothetical protein